MDTPRKIIDEAVRLPHAPLPEYYGKEEDRRAYLHQIFDRTAPDYDRIEKILAFGSGPSYRHHALIRGGLVQGMKLLDVGTGTGLVAIEAAKLIGSGALITGVDPSAGMMEAGHFPEGMSLVEGRAEAIPLPDASFDFVSMGYALRHVSDLSAAFAEFFRVLKPGGKVCILEITTPEKAFTKLLLKTYMRVVIPVIARGVGSVKETKTVWKYYWDTIEACATPQQVMDTLRAAGFSDVKRHCELGMFSEYQATK